MVMNNKLNVFILRFFFFLLFQVEKPNNENEHRVNQTKKVLINMGAGFEQRPWTPTVRRGKISAEMKTPGPANVNLPSLLGLL